MISFTKLKLDDLVRFPVYKSMRDLAGSDSFVLYRTLYFNFNFLHRYPADPSKTVSATTTPRAACIFSLSDAGKDFRSRLRRAVHVMWPTQSFTIH